MEAQSGFFFHFDSTFQLVYPKALRLFGNKKSENNNPAQKALAFT